MELHQDDVGKVEEGGQHEDEEAAGKPGVKPESLEKREHASEVSTGEINEEFVPKNIFLKKENYFFNYGA